MSADSTRRSPHRPPACLVTLAAWGLAVTFSISPAGAAVLPEQIDADMTLTLADSPWEMRSNVLIAAGAEVTVEPDVRVVAHGDYRLTVAGSLTAMSEMGTRIVFRAPDNSSTGAWRGLYFIKGSTGRFQRCTVRSAVDNIMADSADVRLYNCQVRRASRDGLYAWGDSFIKCAYCTFQNNGRHGVHIQTTRPEGAIIYSQFAGSGEHPVKVKATCLEMLRRGNTFSHNTVSAIGVDCGAATDIEDVDVWRNADLPLDLTVGSATADLIIGRDATLRIKSGLRIYPPRRIVVRGRLLVDGLPDARVVIQPQGDASPGDWLGVELEPDAVARVKVATVGFARDGFTLDDARLFMDNAVVRDCQNDGIFAADGSHFDLAGCTIFGCGRSGLHAPQPTCTGKVHSTRISGCGGYPVRIAATVAEALRHNNRYTDNARQAVGVLCSAHPDIRDDDAWLPQGIPFDLTADPAETTLRVRGGARLSLRAGVEVVGGTVSAAGILVAEGTGEHPVTFGSPATSPAPGDWTGIEYVGSSAGRLVNTILTHAESGVSISSPGYIRLVDCELTQCQTDGIRVLEDAVPIISGCSSHHNGRDGIGLWADADPALGADGSSSNPGHNAFYSNGRYNLANRTSHPVLAQSNWWGTTSQAEIAQSILDQGDNSDCGPVNYVPFLESSPASMALAEADAPPLAIMSVTATRTGRGAAIDVRLSRSADVRVVVRNIAGRPVRELHASVQRSGVVPWDGRDMRGVSVPSGRYLVEVEAFSGEGELARALCTLRLGR
ncbi:MAG: FlgD immunoglobulin-like domain containing protein [Armatimonadota bacterium]|nr:FlgD immunoglobulin-like domain containing protein [Armatimonadota bacterium]